MRTPDADAVNPRRSILDEAAEIVDGARQLFYGPPAAYLGAPVSAADVCALNILQKLSRDRHAAKRDNLVDVAGYAENMDRIRRGVEKK